MKVRISLNQLFSLSTEDPLERLSVPWLHLLPGNYDYITTLLEVGDDERKCVCSSVPQRWLASTFEFSAMLDKFFFIIFSVNMETFFCGVVSPRFVPVLGHGRFREVLVLFSCFFWLN